MSEVEPSVLIDGISSIGSHNGVHRVVCYRLTADGKPEPVVELLIGEGPLRGVIAALSDLSESGAKPSAPPSRKLA